MYYEMSEYTGPFRDMVLDYIDFKRGLGYDYGKSQVYRLREIDLFFKARGVSGVTITEEMFEAWVSYRNNESEINRRRRTIALIGFSKYLVQRGQTDVFVGEVPLKAPQRSFVPYIYTKPEISALFDAARKRAAAEPGNRDHATFVTLLSLYYGCGLRKSEAQDLLVRDVDFGAGCLRIMDSKNHVSRLVVAADSVMTQFAQYHDRFCFVSGKDERIFQSVHGTVFPNHKLYRLHREAQIAAGIRLRESGRLPRLHDLRHTFCVHTLEAMSEKGFDIYVSAPLLTKYLGHNCISETEYYLRLVRENFTTVTEKSRTYAPTMFPKVGDVDGE
jgi:integrase